MTSKLLLLKGISIKAITSDEKPLRKDSWRGRKDHWKG